MAQRRRRRSRRWLKRALFLVLLIAAIVVCYFVWDGYFRDKDVKVEDETSQKIVEKVDEREPEQKTETIKKEEIKQYDGDNPNVKNELTGVITFAGVINSELVVRMNIDQYLAVGNCDLKLIQDGNVIYYSSAEIVDSVSTSTCAGFNIPTVELKGGRIEILIELSADGKTGVIKGVVDL